MYLVGVTGGIGSGKSTVAERLAEHGAEVIDADEVAREIVAPGEPALEELVDRFGSGILRPDGTLDRAELARRAFVDDGERRALDRITHPRVAARIAERIAWLAGEADGSEPQLIVVDHPLLIETGQTARFDTVVVVLAEEERRIRRLIDDRGLDEADVRARMRQQVDDDRRRAAATHLIVNDGSREDLLEAVDALHGELVQAAVAAS